MNSPILTRQVFDKLINLKNKTFKADKLSLHYDQNIDLEEAINTLCDRASRSVKKGNVLLVLSDIDLNDKQLTVPSPMAVGAIHHRLINDGIRCDCNIIIETASSWNSHHFAVLLGYGASAIYPYLAYEVINSILDKNKTNDKSD